MGTNDFVKQQENILAPQGDENVLAIPLCRCGRAPHRKAQRNCHHCNREANKKYKAQMNRDAQKFRQMALIARDG